MRNGSTSKSVSRFARQTGLQERNIRAALKVLWRGLVLASVLLIATGSVPEPNLGLNIGLFMVAWAWSYFDGVFQKRMGVVALIEGIFLHLAAAQFTTLLGLAF